MDEPTRSPPERQDDGTTWCGRTDRPTGVVWLTADGGPDAAVDRLRRDAELPASIDVVSVDDMVRSASVAEAPRAQTTIPFGPSDLTVHTLASMADLGPIAETITDRVKALAFAGREPVCCVEALDDLLKTHDLETVFRFCHAVTGSVRARDGVALLAVETDAIDPGVLATIAPLFDDVVDRH